MLGGRLHVAQTGQERAVDAERELPSGAFQVTRIDCNGKGNVGDTHLRLLRRLTQLSVLHLGGTQVTDAGLVYLQGMTTLTRLYLRGSRVTPEGRARLEKAMPGCKVSLDE